MTYYPIFVLLIFFTGCSEINSSTNPAGPANPSGNSDYVEFKLDGTLYRVNNGISPKGTASAASTPQLALYQLNANVSSSTVVPLFSFGIASSQPLQVKRYNYSIGNTKEYPKIAFLKTTTERFVTNFNDTPGYIEFTKVDLAKGGAVEGTFAFDKVERFMEANGKETLLSANHKMTEGKFRLIISN